MHILHALDGLKSLAERTNEKMNAPGYLHADVGDFVTQFYLLLGQMKTEKQKASITPEIHPHFAMIDQWVDIRLRQLLAGPPSMDAWSDAGKALRWISKNCAAIHDLLVTYGGLTDTMSDCAPNYLARDPIPGDAPKGGSGRVRTMWNDTAKSQRANGITMPDWNDADHRALFLTRIDKSSKRSEVLCEKTGLARAFVVRRVQQKKDGEAFGHLDVEWIGNVSSVGSRQMETLGIAQYLLKKADDREDDQAEPLVIRLNMPRPTV